MNKFSYTNLMITTDEIVHTQCHAFVVCMLLTLHMIADCIMTVPAFLVDQVPEFLSAIKNSNGS